MSIFSANQNHFFMKHIPLFLLAVVFSGLVNSCKKDALTTPPQAETVSVVSGARVYSGFPEGFEAGSKTAYAQANVTLGTGSWNLNDALIGTSTSDHINGAKGVRIENTGIVTMNFDVTNGVVQASVAYAKYGSDASSTFSLWYSTNAGSTWTQTGSTITASSTTVSTATFNLTVSGNVRFQLRKLSGGRLNIDDVSIDDGTSGSGGGGATRDDNWGMGNPSGATANVSFPDNYLMTKAQYTLSYNSSRGGANWVSWHLSSAWTGSQPRCDCFNSDGTLPANFYHATDANYTNTGFDRGHQCPSADRDANATDNAATFLMTNMLPQAPHLNQVTWASLENYCRTLSDAGNELYIIAGGYGNGGTGSNGGTTTTIASGHIAVPAHCWKVIVVLPIGTNDASRVTTGTRVIAVDMPNNQSTASTWGGYRVSVNSIEANTGYDFLSNVPTSIQNVIEAAVDNGPTQ